jgi:hypothetical protein
MPKSFNHAHHLENTIIRLSGSFRGKMTYSIITAKRNQPQIKPEILMETLQKRIQAEIAHVIPDCFAVKYIYQGKINYTLKKRITGKNGICSQHYVQFTMKLAVNLRRSFKKISAAGKTKSNPTTRRN